MSKVWGARDDRIGEHFVLKRIEVTCAGEFAKRCQQLIKAFVGFLGTRVEHIAFKDLISLRYEIFPELCKDDIGVLSFLSCHGKVSPYVETFVTHYRYQRGGKDLLILITQFRSGSIIMPTVSEELLTRSPVTFILDGGGISEEL